MTTAVIEDEEKYIKTVVEKYLDMRKRGLIISPRDWEILTVWIRREIPLRLVLNALDVAYGEFDEDRARIKNLSYVKKIVRRLERERKLALVGLPRDLNMPDEEEERTILREGFERLISKLKSLTVDTNFKEVIERTISNIEKLKDEMFSGEIDMEDCFNRLSRIEDGLLTSILNRLPEDILRALENTADKKLQKHRANMNEEGYEKTRKAFIKHLIKIDMKIPGIDPFQ
jgi:hypothetical protein